MSIPILEVNKIGKNFGTVQALSDVNFEIYPNEIVGLVGENGAGKTTLMKCLVGIQKMDYGSIFLNQEPVNISTPKDAHNMGIFMVFQEQSLLMNMAIYENLFLGYENHFFINGMISKTKMIEEAGKLLGRVGIQIDPTIQINKLTFLQRQMVEIMRNIWKADISETKNVILILDEPTSALGEKDTELLFQIMENLKNQASIVFISHKLNEIVRMCNRTYVIKDGYNAGIFNKNEVSEDLLRKHMIGGTIEGEYYLVNMQQHTSNEKILEVRNLTKAGLFEDISFDIHKGEIFCISGVMGSGKESICDVLYGLSQSDSGSIKLEGKDITPKNPNEAVLFGIGYSPDDRKGKGLILGLSVTDNITVSIMKGIISIKKLAEVANSIIKRLRIVTPSGKTQVRNLSGGNQQKTIIGRLIVSKYKLVILAYPTRGVDVGAKREIYALIREISNDGTSIILMGDSFEEEIGLANNIMALKDGKCTGFINADERKPSLEELATYIL